MAKTLGAVLQDARDRLDEATEGRWKDAQLRRWANEAQRDIARRIRWKRATGSVSAVADQQEYNLPADCLEVHAVRYSRTGDNQVYDLHYEDYRFVASQSYTHLTITTNTPVLYWTWGYPGSTTFKMSTYPTPSAAGTFTVHYYAVPSDLSTTGSADTSNVAIPEGYESAVVLYVVYNAQMADADPRWQETKAMYEQTIQQLEEVAVRFTDQASSIAGGHDIAPSFLYAGDDW